jgi:hypothetical protein
MIGTVLVIIAGWFHHKVAALLIVAASIAIQVFLVLPQVTENRRLLGLPQSDLSAFIALTTVELLFAGAFFYFVGYGLRWLRDRAKNPKGPSGLVV